MKLRPHRRNLCRPARPEKWRRRGSEILEAALVFPILLLLAVGTIEFGYWFYLEHNLQAAAREGARAGCVFATGAGDTEIRAAVADIMDQVVNSDQYQVNIDYPTINGNDYVHVVVEVDWTKVGVDTGMTMHNRGSAAQTEFVDQKTMQGSATMRIEANGP